MSRRTIKIIIAIFILIFLFLGGLLLYTGSLHKSEEGKGITIDLPNFFPFRGSSGSVTVPLPKPIVDIFDTQGPDPESTKNEGVYTPLRVLSTVPVAGFTFIEREVPLDPDAPAQTTTKTLQPTYLFVNELAKGAKGAEVAELQKVLSMCPETAFAIETLTTPADPKKKTKRTVEYVFGEKMQKAVVVFQEKFAAEILTPRKLMNGTGVLDELTRKKINAEHTCTPVLLEKPKLIKKTFVRYAEKATGNIVDVSLDTIEQKKVTRTVIPRIQEAFFGKEGKMVLLRYIRSDGRTIETFVASITEGSSSEGSELVGVFREPNLMDVSVSPDGTRIFAISKFVNDFVGTVSNFSGLEKKTVFNSPFSGWLSQWAVGDTISVTTKASAYAKGYAYKLKPDGTGFERLFGNVSALTTNLSPDGSKLLYSKNTRGGATLSLYVPKDGSAKDTGVLTLPEKCAWGKTSMTAYCGVPKTQGEGVLPDSWYQGLTSFDDVLWSVDLSGPFFNENLGDPTEIAGALLDVSNPKVDDTETYFVFINKRDGILWKYDIKKPEQPTPPNQ